ncbi:hypothetical protein OS189_11150 [Sulfitobacter sp. F26169L]|uniref:hypothetical protein n=1 Tax=Sulfitobacter sp. F26169L TaxID=2996015 RepID=UPI002260A9AB|nr:hypothetical protein [Sulfitobacter sp. F26169L]MCX7566896.1 hypothetical protein [Sulfitobacter sp. F26169L]
MFFRPEAKAALWRWREMLVALGLVLLGLWWIIGPGRLLALPGWALLLGGIALALVGLQRARFRREGNGPGAVQVDEGQIAYFGPLTGGVVALNALERLSLDATARPAHWRLDAKGQAAVLIPVNAAGSDALFDAFATLPGLRTERMLSELNARRDHAVVIWERTPLRPAHALLH